MTRRSFKRATESQRRRELIDAAIECVGEKGLQRATVREVAMRAGVSNGLIRHYFAGKSALMQAAYETIMEHMMMDALARADDNASAHLRLRNFVIGNVSPPVVDKATLSLWAQFIGLIHIDSAMSAIHNTAYRRFRGELEKLISAVFHSHGRMASAEEIKSLGVKVNAVIDGLWLEGCLSDDLFGTDELAMCAIESVEAILQLGLPAEK